jgi:hypothetical protein
MAGGAYFAVVEAWEKREGRIAGRRREERQARPWRGARIALRRRGIEAVAGAAMARESMTLTRRGIEAVAGAAKARESDCEKCNFIISNKRRSVQRRAVA